MAKTIKRNRTASLTLGEMKIVKALSKLEKLWSQEGENLILIGNSLRKDGAYLGDEVITFPLINDHDISTRF